MIKFSRSEDYAIILVHTLTNAYKKRLVPLSEIASQYKISVLFLRNLANSLKHAGIVDAIEGKQGGYFLVKDPKKLKVGDILHAFSKNPLLPCCDIGHIKGNCDKSAFCETGKIWRKLNQEFLEKVSSLTIEQFITYSGKK